MEVKGGMGMLSPKSRDYLALPELPFHCSLWGFVCQHHEPCLV